MVFNNFLQSPERSGRRDSTSSKKEKNKRRASSFPFQPYHIELSMCELEVRALEVKNIPQGVAAISREKEKFRNKNTDPAPQSTKAPQKGKPGGSLCGCGW